MRSFDVVVSSLDGLELDCEMTVTCHGDHYMAACVAAGEYHTDYGFEDDLYPVVFEVTDRVEEVTNKYKIDVRTEVVHEIEEWL